jgi:hypothetical protein
MKESDCTGGEKALQGELADCGKFLLHVTVSTLADTGRAGVVIAEELAGESTYFFLDPVNGFLR